MVRLIRAALAIFIVGLFIFAARSTPTLPLDKIKLPPGFSIKVFAIGVPNARQMALGSNGVIFAGSREAGNLYAIVDHSKDNRRAEVIKIAKPNFHRRTRFMESQRSHRLSRHACAFGRK